jgi:hypothetical protein
MPFPLPSLVSIIFSTPSFAPGLPQEGPVIITMPAWIPGHDFRAYLTGAIFIDCTLGLLSRRYARSGNHCAGPDPVSTSHHYCQGFRYRKRSELSGYSFRAGWPRVFPCRGHARHSLGYRQRSRNPAILCPPGLRLWNARPFVTKPELSPFLATFF